MAAAETARLIAELSLKDKLSPGVKTATASLGRLDTSLGRIGQSAKRGAAVAGKALLGIGAVAAVGIAAGVRSGLQDLATLESAVTSADGAINQMGLTGQITGAQIATMANEIEANIGAAFDDKDITQATTTLIRFGKVTPANLRPAMEVMADLATKTGSVDSAATLLAKALADPEKAAGKLARTGVILTKAEQAQIKALVKAGKTAAAQKVILDSLAKSTKGAAAVSQGPYQRALSTLADVSEDAKKALAEGFLPVIERVADKMSKGLADPKVMDDIRSMGKGLAGAFDEAVTFAEKVPWGAIKDGLKTSAEWAGRLFDAFRSMPPEMQTTIVALAGLNKLSGGAVSGIVGELGKGLIKGVLGINAGVVNVRGAVVNGGGVGAGGAGAGASGPGAMGTAKTAAVFTGAGAVWLSANEITRAISDAIVPALAGGRSESDKELVRDLVQTPVRVFFPGFEALTNLDQLPGQIGKLIEAVQGGPTVDRQTALLADTHSEQIATTRAVADVQKAQAASLVAFRAGERTSATGLANTTSAARVAGVSAAAASVAGAARVAGAIGANRPIVTTSVVVNVTAANVTKSVTVQSRYGPGGGSANGGHAPGRPGGGP